MRKDLFLVRKSRNRLNPDITRRKLKKIADAASRNQSLGFEGRVGRLEEPSLLLNDNGEEVHLYKVRLRLQKDNVRSADTVQAKLDHVIRVVTRCANSEGWEVLDGASPEQGSSSTAEEPSGELPAAVARVPFVVPDLDEAVYRDFFAGVFERNAHIRTIHDAVRTCQESDGEVLSHVLLYGLPGAAKTVLCKRLKAWYEADLPPGTVPHVLFTNNISTTKAGLENYLLGLAEDNALPHVLVLDEIEKQPLDNLLCLNTLMSEGLLTKLNARVGFRREEARFTVIGICNDEQKLKSFQNGHLWSRFTHKLRCVRPSRELCLHILKQEAVKLPGGNEEWAEAALTFGWDVLGQRDIREIRGHLDGRDRLLDGSWQADQMAMIAAAKAEDATLTSTI